MAGVFIVFTALLLCLPDFSDGNVRQSPPSLFESPGHSAELQCSHNISNYDQMYWYQQSRKGALHLIGYLYNERVNLEEKFKKSFNLTGNARKAGYLIISNLTAEDSAVYFCAASITRSYEAYFGKGTKLTVLEHDISEPILHILEPSKEEIVQKNRVTLVCLATNFYPDHINITWKINGKNREDGVKTDDYATKDDKNTYSISSRFRLTLREWFNPENTFTCAVKFYKGNGSETVTPEKHISGKDGCGMTKALNKNESVAARISYVLLVGKSFLYGLFVTFLVWKLRPNSSSKRLN